MVKLLEGDDMRKLRIEAHGVPAYCMKIEECISVEVKADGKPWYHDIKAYIKSNEYSSSAMGSEKKLIQCMACPFFLSGEVLYKRNRNSTLLQCIDTSEANHLMEEMHEGLASIWEAHFPMEVFFHVGLMHYSQDPQIPYSTTFSLKLGPMALFIHLKIILL